MKIGGAYAPPILEFLETSARFLQPGKTGSLSR